MNQLELKKVIRPVILIVALMIAVYTIVHYGTTIMQRRGHVMVEFVVTLFRSLQM